MSSVTALTELEDLRLYLQERIQEFDESIDTSIGSSADSTIIQPLLARLGPDPYNTPIRDFAISRLRTEFPDLVLQDGEPLDDYAIKIMQILLEPFRRQIKQISLNQSLAEPSTLNEREADNLGANFFVRRKLGGYSVGIARLYYTAPQYALVTPSNPVFDAAGHRFFPVENQAIMSDRMLFNLEDNLYFFDIVVRAESQGTEYDIEENSLTGIENVPSVVKVTNRRAFSDGGDKETTVEFIERVENSLTEKSLVTLRGITARIVDVFESVRLIQVIGFGDPEMNRDIITGISETAPHSYFPAILAASSYEIDLYTTSPYPVIEPDGTIHADFSTSLIQVGDILEAPFNGQGDFYRAIVEEILSSTKLRVDTASPYTNSAKPMTARRAEGAIAISDIPGGILSPSSEISIVDNQVHIGGALDVFVRGGDPQDRDITLEGILDGEPLHFGLDLETYGDGNDQGETQLIHITERSTPLDATAHAAVPLNDRYGNALAGLDELVIRQYYDPAGSEPYHPWVPTEDDVDRYVQLLGPTDFGTFKISEVLEEEYYNDGSNDYRCIRIKIDTTTGDVESGNTTPPFLTAVATFSRVIRLVEEVTLKDRVRDRDGSSVVIAADDPVPGRPVILGGADFATLNAAIGDSVVIETGEDAGIYSIRRILSWLADDDTLILDRELTRTVTPTGTGDGSGARYRIADELNVDLIAPKITKIPLGNIFNGDDLSTVADSLVVTASGGTNFLLAGVEAGDTLEILEGENIGTYGITEVTGTTATLDSSTPSTGFAQSFTIYKAFEGVTRPLVRVSGIELLDSSSQPTGITIPYGDVIDTRIFGTLSNRAEGNTVERFTGEIVDSVTFQDTNIDWTAEEVEAGYRLNILAGNSVGSYTIRHLGPDVPASEGGPLSVNHLRVEPLTDGGDEFKGAESPLHYSVGLPSSGYARLYFQEPTSVEIETGLGSNSVKGGRLQTGDDEAPKEFRFSEVDGYAVVPAGGSDEDNPRDLRVVRTWEDSPNEFSTVVEMTDDTRPGVFELEIQEGDILQVNEQIPFRNSGGSTFAELGVFGKPAGLRTTSGSNRVTVPDCSLIDFTQMDSVFPLVGQILMIDSGPDEGQYTIEEVVDSKTLRLDRVLTATTDSIKGLDVNPRTDVSLDVSGSKTKITDTTDFGQFGTLIGHFITIFESTRGDIDGTYEISDLLAGDPDAVEIDASFDSPTAVLDPFAVGQFTWVRTSDDELVEQEFRIYKTIPKEFEITQVATKRSEVVPGVRRGDITSSTTLTDVGGLALNAQQGDILEILSGPSAGTYHLAADSAGAVATIFANPAFPLTISDVPYRIWGGLHGSRRMLTAGPSGSFDGQLDPGEQMPYRILRPRVLRVSSTEMQDNFDGSLYYTDVQIESQGAGDDLNLSDSTRMVVTRGLSADGYTYTVQNENLTFSMFEEVSLNFDRRFLPLGNSDSPENLTEVSGRNLEVSYETSTPTRLVNDLMRSDQERPVNANPIARHFLPSFLYTTLTYSGGVTEDTVGQDIEDYVNTLGAEDEIEVSDLEAFLTKRGATYVKHPITILTVTHDLGRKLVVNRSNDKLGGLNTVPFNGTGRISSFFTTLGESLILVRES